MSPLQEESGCEEDEGEDEEESREEEEEAGFDSDESLVDSDSDSDEKGAYFHIAWNSFISFHFLYLLYPGTEILNSFSKLKKKKPLENLFSPQGVIKGTKSRQRIMKTV